MTAEEIKDNRAIELELAAKNLDKKVTLLSCLSTFPHLILTLLVKSWIRRLKSVSHEGKYEAVFITAASLFHMQCHTFTGVSKCF